MCGLNFIHYKNSLGSENQILEMNKAIVHRGPDASKFTQTNFQIGVAYFGHNRLRVHDLSSASDQPFVSECGNYFMVFNGEISNFETLKKELVKNYNCVFKTKSDTEVLFQLLINEGGKSIFKLKGMFAFVFLDKKQNSLIVARDFYGIKPLYYFENEQVLVISSEIRGILASGLVRKELNESQINQYLTFRFAQKPQTFYKKIFEIVPFRNPNFETQQPHRIIEKESFVSENPIGLFLSGGIDSTYIGVTAKRDFSVDLPCFTVADKNYLETDFDYIYSEKVAKELKLEFNPLFLDATIYNEWENFVSATDQPVADPAAMLTWKLAEFAKKKVNSVISGAGADELLGGYNRHYAFQQYLKYKTLLLTSKPILHKIFKNNPEKAKFLTTISGSEADTFINFTKLFYEFDSKLKVNPVEDNNWMQWALHFDVENYLFSDVLSISDKYASQHGLEVLVPFLNSYQTSFPAKIGKQQLKDRLNKEGFKYINFRDKHGFGINLQKWMFDEIFTDLVKKYLQNSKLLIFNYVSLELVERNLEEFYLKNKDNSQQIWALLLLSTWLEKEFN